MHNGPQMEDIPLDLVINWDQTAIWFITHTPNHWANEDTMVEYIEKVFLLYVCKRGRTLTYHLTIHGQHWPFLMYLKDNAQRLYCPCWKRIIFIL